MKCQVGLVPFVKRQSVNTFEVSVGDNCDLAAIRSAYLNSAFNEITLVFKKSYRSSGAEVDADVLPYRVPNDCIFRKEWCCH
jgi:hypothetical protein